MRWSTKCLRYWTRRWIKDCCFAYMVDWVAMDLEELTWEPAENVEHAKDAVAGCHRTHMHPQRPSPRDLPARRRPPPRSNSLKLLSLVLSDVACRSYLSLNLRVQSRGTFLSCFTTCLTLNSGLNSDVLVFPNFSGWLRSAKQPHFGLNWACYSE